MLTGVVRRGSHPAGVVRHARILLELDVNAGYPGLTFAQVAARVGVHVNTVARVVGAWASAGGDAGVVIGRKKPSAPPVPSKVTGEVEARLIALACSQPPEGRVRWTLRLLEKHVELTNGMPGLDHTTIHRVLKKRSFALT
jgi:transposase